MALAYVQRGISASGGGTAVSSVVVTMQTGNIATGNAVVGGIQWSNSGGTAAAADITTISDGTNTYQKGAYYVNGGSGYMLFFGFRLIGGHNTITVNFNGTIAQYTGIVCHEVSGGSVAIDKYTSQFLAASGQTTTSSGNMTPTYNGEYLYSFLNSGNGGFVTNAVMNSPFTTVNGWGGPYLLDGYDVQAIAASIAATWTLTPNNSGQNTFTFLAGLTPAPRVQVLLVT